MAIQMRLAMTIAARIRQGREVRGLVQEDLARQIDVSSMTVSRWERGVVTPSVGHCRKMARALVVSLDWLIDGRGEGPEEPISASESLDPTGT